MYKRAWLGKPIPSAQNEENIIPLIHVDDLVSLIFKVINDQPATKYIVGVTSNEKAKAISEAIASNLGNGKYEKVDKNVVPAFRFNMSFKSSKQFEGIQLVCNGLVANIKAIISEFMKYRGLKRVAVFVTGPPASAKTKYASAIAKHFNLPHLLIKDMIEEAKKGKDGETINKVLEEEKKRVVDEIEALNKKKKKVDTDPSKVVPRLPDKMVINIVKDRLMQTDCQLRGYILDGYPKTYLNALRIFVQNTSEFTEEIAQNQTEEEFLKVFPLNPKLAINYAVNIEATDEFIINKVKELAADKAANTHYTEDNTNRRLKKYHTDNPEDSDNINEFLKAMGIATIPSNITTTKEDEILKGIYNNIEKTGKVSTFEPIFVKHDISVDAFKEPQEVKEYIIYAGKQSKK